MSTPRIDRLEENIFINGGMRFAQRSVGPVNTAVTGYYSVDRYITGSVGTTSPATRRTGPIGIGSPYTANYTNGLNATINSASDTLFCAQRIEAARLQAILGDERKISGSLKVGPSVDCDVRIVIEAAVATDDWSSATVVYDQTFPITNAAVQTVKYEDIDLTDSNVANGISVTIVFQNWSATGAQFVDHTDWMLNAGTAVAAFNERSPEEEFQLCQRYYQKTWQQDVAAGSANTTGRKIIPSFMSTANRIEEHRVELATTMRVEVPTISLWSNNNTATRVSWVTRTASADNAIASITRTTSRSFNIEVAAASGGARGDAALLNFHYTADAEL